MSEESRNVPELEASDGRSASNGIYGLARRGRLGEDNFAAGDASQSSSGMSMGVEGRERDRDALSTRSKMWLCGS